MNFNRFLFVKPNQAQLPKLAKIYNFFIVTEIIALALYVTGQLSILICRALFGPGQAGHITPGSWMLALPLIFIGSFGIVILKVTGILISIFALYKKYLAKHFILATTALFLLTAWNGSGGIIAYLLSLLKRI